MVILGFGTIHVDLFSTPGINFRRFGEGSSDGMFNLRRMPFR